MLPRDQAHAWWRPLTRNLLVASLVAVGGFGQAYADGDDSGSDATTSSASEDTLHSGLHPPPCGAASESPLATAIPARLSDAETGSAFVRRTTGWDGRKRQAAALEQLRQGNMPEFLRLLKPVHMAANLPGERKVEVVLWVAPDYVAVGNDSDFVRMPLSLPVAVTLASELGFVLPTRKIVDAIYQQSDFQLAPKPLPPGTMMRSSQYYAQHNAAIEEERQGRPLGELLAGHKKDIVMTNRVFGTENIAIYGWHKRDGKPIQNLSLVHAARYADYSHGVRLVYSIVCVDGVPTPILDVLQNSDIAAVLTYEGVLGRVQGFMDRRAWQ